MQLEPAMGNGGVNRPGVFRGAAASGHELLIDLAYRHTTLNDFDRIRQLKQFPLGCLGRGERAIFPGISSSILWSFCGKRELYFARLKLPPRRGTPTVFLS